MSRFDDILDRYRMRITDSRKKETYYAPLPLSYQIEMTAEQEMFMRRFHEEKIFSIEINESDLNRLEDDLKHFYQVRNPYERQEIEEREAHLRKNNPAVKKAWENYKMLLKLAAEGRVYD